MKKHRDILRVGILLTLEYKISFQTAILFFFVSALSIAAVAKLRWGGDTSMLPRGSVHGHQ